MKTYLLLLSLFLLLFYSCKEREYIAMFQGEWMKKGEPQKAFRVHTDSIYFLGLEKGYFYQFRKDTLIIHFTEQVTKNAIISLNENECVILDVSRTNDTVHLVKSVSRKND